jgi:hypothetical protein
MEAATAPPEQTTKERAARRATILVLTTAELAPCTCPDTCERDHDRD